MRKPGFLTNNIGLKIASLLVAIIVWMVVVNISNPEISGTKTVQVELLNEDVILDAGKTYELQSSRTVTVSYNVRARDEYKIKSTDFRAYVDFENLYSLTGSAPVIVEVLNNRNLFTRTPEAKPGTLKIKIEDVVSSEHNINIYIVGKAEAGYTFGEAAIDPYEVTLKGPDSLIREVAAAAINIDIEGRTETFSGREKIVFYDAKGKLMEIDDPRLTWDNEYVDYTLSINPVNPPSEPADVPPEPETEPEPQTPPETAPQIPAETPASFNPHVQSPIGPGVTESAAPESTEESPETEQEATEQTEPDQEGESPEETSEDESAAPEESEEEEDPENKPSETEETTVFVHETAQAVKSGETETVPKEETFAETEEQKPEKTEESTAANAGE